MVKNRGEYGLVPSWVALATLPMAMALLQISTQTIRSGAVGNAHQAELAGMLSAAVLSLFVGPHLTAVAAALLLSVFLGWSGLRPGMAAPVFGAIAAHGASTVTIVAAAGVSAGGGAPGLRYAISVSLYALFLLAISPVNPSFSVQIGLAITLSFVLLVPTATWWLSTRHPRPATEGASRRTILVTLALVIILVAVQGSQELLATTVPLQTPYLHSIALLTTSVTAAMMVFILVILQFLRQPARFGGLAGLGTLTLSSAAVFGSMGPAIPPELLTIVVAFSLVSIVPWTWARATSDVAWRLSSAMAVLVFIPTFLPHPLHPLWPVGCAIGLVFAVLLIGPLGWFSDEWIFGDVPGSALGGRR